MSAAWLVVVAGLGIVYGYVKPGKQDKWRIFKTGMVIGIAVGVVFFLMGSIAWAGPILTAFAATVAFIVGVWIGDLLE